MSNPWLNLLGKKITLFSIVSFNKSNIRLQSIIHSYLIEGKSSTPTKFKVSPPNSLLLNTRQWIKLFATKTVTEHCCRRELSTHQCVFSKSLKGQWLFVWRPHQEQRVFWSRSSPSQPIAGYSISGRIRPISGSLYNLMLLWLVIRSSGKGQHVTKSSLAVTLSCDSTTKIPFPIFDLLS